MSGQFKTITYYDLLGVDVKAGRQAISEAYRANVARYHPDISNAPNAERMTALLNDAKSILLDDSLRQEYDAFVTSIDSGQFENVSTKADDLIALLKDARLEVTDKRSSGGCIWVVGGLEFQPAMERFRERGHEFTFAPQGGRATHHRPAWYLRAGRQDGGRSQS